MMTKAAPLIALILFLLPELASSQSTTKSPRLVMDIQFNGTETSGTCSKTDSVLTVSGSDGVTYHIVSIGMNIGEKYYRTPGNILSSEMKNALSKSRSGDEVFFILKVGAIRHPMMQVAASYIIE